ILHIFNLYLSTELSTRSPRSSLFSLILFFLIFLYFGLRTPKEKWLKEPPEGRYSDYRVNMRYISGLSKKNRAKHLEKYKGLLEQSSQMEF
ncbi:MAG: hypothetical protein ACXAAI_13025, partial [Promethearchaeota archaeon]